MLITYLLAVIANVLNIVFIIFDKRLHKPMYLLICNLAVVDLLYTSMGVVLTLEERQGLLIGNILGPAVVNPFVYCFRTKEIKNKIFKIFTKNGI
ncbi:olfactory receptor 13C8-like [Oreochromis niloticus]|uniref:olfactory receptor 13C8-like n=1 Tax=Oreochromis niloticus TaxID=8128 RepID=UPI00090524C0|nr:olfactory receptor 13C8-like [Oreochromis niloticus]XP_039453967.1 olfactory receptor 1509-like [Oreochromis aureus]